MTSSVIGSDSFRCDPEIFAKGKGVCVVAGSRESVEIWVRSVAKRAQARVDWHYSGELANILHLGDGKSRELVLKAIRKLKSTLNGTVMNINCPSLPRIGVPDEGKNPARGAIVREVDRKLVLEDPEALAMARAWARQNCRKTFTANSDRIIHFRSRILERKLSPKDYVIAILNVDDPHGGPIVDVIMPGYNWQELRDRGRVPFARGLVSRWFIQKALQRFDRRAAKKLAKSSNKIPTIVVDHNVAEIFVI